MNVLIKTLILALTLFTAACQKGSDSQDISGTIILVDKFDTNPDTENLDHAPWVEPWSGNFDKRLDRFQVSCEGSDCPASMATFISQKELADGSDSFSVCGGALQNKNHVITARHCVDKKILSKGASCSDRGYFLFPATGDLPAVSARCLEIVDFAKIHPNQSDDKRQPDWVIIKLDRSIPNRVQPVNISGIQDGQKLLFFKPMYDKEDQLVKIHRLKCNGVLGSHLLPSSDQATSPLTLIHCPKRLLSAGYSGFGFYSEQGELIASESHIVKNIRSDQKHSHFAVASNLACLDTQGDADLEKSCAWAPQSSLSLNRKLFVKKAKRVQKKQRQKLFQWVDTQDQHPLLWEEVDLTNLDQVPADFRILYKDFSRIEGFEGTPLEIEKHQNAALLMGPAYPKCVNPASTTGAKTPVTVPVPYLLVVENEMGQPQFKMEILELPAVLRQKRKDPTQFRLSLQKSIQYPIVPKRKDGRPQVVKYRGSHFPTNGVTLPSCP